MVRLLVYGGGVATTVIGSWVSSKLHVYHDSRQAHLDEIKQKVLLPVRDELERFRPFVFQGSPLACVVRGATKHHEKARVTEEQVEEGAILSAAFPTGWLFNVTESALLEDARRNHFRELTGRLDKFAVHWTDYAGECLQWVAKMAAEISEQSGLPEFPTRAVEVGIPPPYVMHYELAIFCYSRLFGLRVPALQHRELSPGTWVVEQESTILSLGPEDRLAALVQQLNDMIDSQTDVSERLLNRAITLQAQFTQTARQLNLAIASRRLRSRCDLVTFF